MRRLVFADVHRSSGVVCNREQRTVIGAQGRFQRLCRLDVRMVAWLVQQ